MEKIKNVLIVIILILLIFFGGKWYLDNSKYKSEENKYKNEIAKQDSLIKYYNDSIVKLETVSTLLLNKISDRDSIIKIQKGSIVYINNKYNNLRKGINKASADSSVKYLTVRLNKIDTSYKSETPQLIKLEGDSMCLLDIEQVKMVNLTFIGLDEKIEELDTTKAIVENLECEVSDYKDLVDNKDKIIELKDSVITSNENKIDVGDKEQKRLKKEIRKQKIQKWVAVGVAILTIGIVVTL